MPHFKNVICTLTFDNKNIQNIGYSINISTYEYHKHHQHRIFQPILSVNNVKKVNLLKYQIQRTVGMLNCTKLNITRF